MYVDVLVFENFIINLLLLHITGKFSKLKTSRLKLLLGSIVGAFYAVVSFFPDLKLLLSMPMKIAISVLMVTVAFTPDNFRDFFKALGIFYIISFAFGGAAFALFFITGRGWIEYGVFYIMDFPISLLIIALAIGYLLLVYCWDYIQSRVLKEKLIYNVTVLMGGKEANFNAILDTGNSLKDPVSGLPVIVAEYDVMKGLLPAKMQLVFKEKANDIDLEELYKQMGNTRWMLRIRLIPFSSLGKENGMLLGIKPDMVILHQRKFIREIKDVIIGIYNSKIGKDGDYRGLLYSEILR